jgi:hypothetical protein
MVLKPYTHAFRQGKKNAGRVGLQNEEVLWGMNLEEPIYLYRQVPESHKDKK